MDESEQYVKMCEKAVEIQKLWLDHDTQGDYAVPTKTIDDYQGWWTLEANQVYIVGNDGEHDVDIEDEEDIKEGGFVWLPRQDQLQEMVCGNLDECLDALHEFALYQCFEPALWEDCREDFFKNSDNSFLASPHVCIVKDEIKKFTSMEQLWLGLVMKEKYHKKWDGENWILC